MSLSASPSRQISVNLGERSYQILVGRGVLASAPDQFDQWLSQRGSRPARRSALVITDPNVAMHAQALLQALRDVGWRAEVFEIPAGESAKCVEVISEIWDALVEFRADRKSVVIAVGGGVVGDAAGFAAATFARGVRFLQVPSTLLADVDSSVGGKVGINHPHAKNLIGAFHQPTGVLIDVSLLDTLPDREYLSGLAEVVKYGVILDAGFFEFLEANADALRERDVDALTQAVTRSCELKAQVVEADEFELTGLRAILNYGHTFAHAFETLSGYSELLHGEAVAIGMMYASQLAERLGRISASDTQRQRELLSRLGLPTRLPDTGSMSAADLLDRMMLDKKTEGGRLRFVLPRRIGHVELVDGVSLELVQHLLQAEGH